jgi:hypothetical protein
MLQDGAYDEKKVENDERKVGKDPYRQHLCNTRFMKPCMDNKFNSLLALASSQFSNSKSKIMLDILY